jgi:hypothetical protein
MSKNILKILVMKFFMVNIDASFWQSILFWKMYFILCTHVQNSDTIVPW